VPAPDSPALHDAISELVKLSKFKALDVVYRGCIMAMLAFLRLYVDGTGMDWTVASGLAATAAGKGHGLVWYLRAWTWQFLGDKNKLPVSLYGRHIKSVIEDEDIAQDIHLHLQSLDKRYLCTRDIVQYLDKPAVKERLGLKNMPSECMAQCWMHTMEYQYGKPKNGMYVDGHECEDVVAYRTKVFLPFWMSIESWMMKWDNNYCAP